MPDINTAINDLTRISDALSNFNLIFTAACLGITLSLTAISIALSSIAKAIKGKE